jgi:Raf kinase inhibitor-like YbhB/YbcL family protein
MSYKSPASLTYDLLIVIAGIVAELSACTISDADQVEHPQTHITVSSVSMPDGTIPARYACYESGATPALAWSSVPEASKSFAVIAKDLDSTLSSLIGPFVHWVVYDIPLSERELPDALPARAELANGTRQGVNGFGKLGFAGPCPPGKSSHRYEFTVYAVDTVLNLASGSTDKALLAAMRGHVIASGSFIAHYKR